MKYYKPWNKITHSGLKPLAEECTENYQYGFRENKSTFDQLLIIK